MPGPWDHSNDKDNDKASGPASESEKPRSPWDDARKKPQNQIPNLDDLMRRHERAQKQKQNQKSNVPEPEHKQNSFFSDHNWAQNHIVMAVLCGILLLWIVTGFYKVEPDEQGVVLRFGEMVRTAPSGFGYHWPYPIETVLKPKVTRVNQTFVDFRNGKDKNLIMTKDQNLLNVDFMVNWNIRDAKDYLFNVRDPDSTIKMAAESVMREVIGQSDIQNALTDGRQRIEQQAQEELQALLDEYQAGLTVQKVLLQKVDPPDEVIESFRDVQRAKSEQDKASNDAQGYANDIVPRAKGEAERIKAEAEGYRQQTVSRAQGEAARFANVYEAYKQAPDITTKRIYIETMEQLMHQSKRVILDSDLKSTMPVLPLDVLRASPEKGVVR